MFYPVDAISGFLIVLFSIFYWRYTKKQEKLGFKIAKAQFLNLPQTKLYLKKGYEISKITDLGNDEYEFNLTLNPDKDPSNPKNKKIHQEIKKSI
ncbi:hypothetical protein [Helicobacter sp. 13S00477-4]|uniref:hypothetical protein n=1 Tax=Helicobacter sp. 13S00477-4 TaxID=1905759 RepID=UPI000BA6A0ED|nr:hypothetical protein [Helicobacter sp. 13S00477-4]PAF51280.1 hypothetical protein BKH44_06125 [Helicobacter sp. 13S00477-4]